MHIYVDYIYYSFFQCWERSRIFECQIWKILSIHHLIFISSLLLLIRLKQGIICPCLVVKTPNLKHLESDRKWKFRFRVDQRRNINCTYNCKLVWRMEMCRIGLTNIYVFVYLSQPLFHLNEVIVVNFFA